MILKIRLLDLGKITKDVKIETMFQFPRDLKCRLCFPHPPLSSLLEEEFLLGINDDKHDHLK